VSGKKNYSDIISYKCGAQDIESLNKLRVAGKVLRWWYATDKFYYEIKN